MHFLYIMLFSLAVSAALQRRRLCAFQTALCTIVGLLFIRTKFTLVRARSNDYWRHRNRVPRVCRWPLDLLMSVDSSRSSVDTPTKPSQSITIESCVASKDKIYVDLSRHVTKLLPSLDLPGSTGRVRISVFDLFQLCEDGFLARTEPCTLDILYTGHANPAKKMPAKSYFVRYNVAEGEVVQFPPYGVLERQKKGFGVPKIKSAITLGPKVSDLTRLTQVCAGPRNNFYVDCGDESVAKEFIGVEADTSVVVSGRGVGKTLKIPGHFKYTHLVCGDNVQPDGNTM